jgi:hypothetical protein
MFRQNTFAGGANGVAITTANSGANSGDRFDVTSYLPYFSTDQAPPNASMCMKLAPVSGEAFPQVEFYVPWITPVTAVPPDLYTRQYLYFPAFSTLTSNAYAVYDTASGTGGTGSSQVQITSAGKIQIICSGSTTITSSYVMSTSTWYRLEAHFVTGTGANAQTYVQLYNMAGTLLWSGNSAANGTWTPGTRIRFSFGSNGGQVSQNYYMGLLAISDSGWIGAYTPPAVSSAGMFL